MSRFCGVKISGSISEKVQQMIDACINAECEKFKVTVDALNSYLKVSDNTKELSEKVRAVVSYDFTSEPSMKTALSIKPVIDTLIPKFTKVEHPKNLHYLARSTTSSIIFMDVGLYLSSANGLENSPNFQDVSEAFVVYTRYFGYSKLISSLDQHVMYTPKGDGDYARIYEYDYENSTVINSTLSTILVFYYRKICNTNIEILSSKVQEDLKIFCIYWLLSVHSHNTEEICKKYKLDTEVSKTILNIKNFINYVGHRELCELFLFGELDKFYTKEAIRNVIVNNIRKLECFGNNVTNKMQLGYGSTNVIGYLIDLGIDDTQIDVDFTQTVIYEMLFNSSVSCTKVFLKRKYKEYLEVLGYTKFLFNIISGIDNEEEFGNIDFELKLGIYEKVHESLLSSLNFNKSCAINLIKESKKYKLDRDRILLDVKLGLNSNNSISK